MATLAVLATGLGLTAAVSYGAWSVHDRGEDRLLGQRVLAASSLLVAAVPPIQTVLTSAVELAEESGAVPDVFGRTMRPDVGEGRRFVGASLWMVGEAAPLASVGVPSHLTSRPAEEIDAVLATAIELEGLTVHPFLDDPEPRIGYAVASNRDGARYVVYAETALPPDRMSVPQPGSAFEDVDYALYLGATESIESLLISSTPDLPISGRRIAAETPFGNTSINLVMSPHGVLGGEWDQRSWWLIALAGTAITLGAAGLTERLFRSRDRARRLSDENARLYAEQRTVAQTLQHSMLPDVLPDVPGVELAVRYVPGVAGIDVGGDWYDVVDAGSGRLLLVVGDVSGRGLEAATIMAELRFAIRAFASDGDDPATILEKLGRLVSVERDGHFATVLCAAVDVRTGEVTVASAGHPAPVVVDGGRAEPVPTFVGVPVGVRATEPYRSVPAGLRPGATLIVFTDGLVERRGETFDDGVDRLCRVAASGSDGVEELLSRLLAELTPEGTDDDTAILGLRWNG